MKILIGILSFSLGWIIGVYTRKILIKIIKTKTMIKEAKKIIEREEKRAEFKGKYDLFDYKEEENGTKNKNN